MKCAVLLVLLVSITVACCMSSEDGAVQLRKREQYCTHPNCITHGYGCVGQYGACAGICYCYGSGYEYRCHYCDIFG